MPRLIRGLLVTAAGLGLAMPLPATAATLLVTIPGIEDRRTLIIIVAASVLVITVLAILIILYRRARPAGMEEAEHESKAYLNVLYGNTPVQRHELGKRPTMLGRVAGPENSRLDYVVVPESTVGRRHALIEYKDYAYWIIDQGSINGTFVNNKMISTEARLKHGDRIRLHKYEFEFIVPELIDTGDTVVSNTVYNTAAVDADDDDDRFDRSRIQLSEEDFADSDDEDDSAVRTDRRMDSNPVRIDIPLHGGEEESDGEDVTLAPGMDTDGSPEEVALQRSTEKRAPRNSDRNNDDE